MKSFFFIILCVNIIFFFWEIRSGAMYSVNKEKQETIKDQKTIFLPHEVKLKKTMDVNLENSNIFTNEKQISNINRDCLDIGPFKDKDSAREWLNSIETHLKSPEIIEKEIQGPLKYIVYFPAAETFEKSEANVDMLKELGAKDVWLFRQGELRGIVSLGVFFQLDRAEIVQNRFKEKNVDIKIMERQLTENVFFITASLKSKDQPILDQVAVDSKVTVSKIICH